jgi:hypothetical protein
VSKVGIDDMVARGADAEKLRGLPRVESWPKLAPEALYGLPGRIVDAIDPHTEADPVATLIHVLASVGNLIGPGPHTRVQHDQHPGRLNGALVGRTSKARKGTSWSTPRHMLAQVDPAWARDRVKQGLSSGEGLIYHVRDEQWGKRRKKDKRQVADHEDILVDEGVPDKRLLILEPELAVVLKVMAREGNTLSGVIRQAWDCGDLSTLTRNNPLKATGTHVSIVGHITEEELRRYLTETERANGFANRFLWLLVRRSKDLPEGEPPPDHTLDPLVRELREVMALARAIGEVHRDEDAKAIWRGMYPRLAAGEPGLFGAIISRAEAQVLRLSLLYAVMDCSATIRLPHLKAALAVWDYAEASARRIFGRRLGSPIADITLEALRVRGPMTETEISGLFGRHKSAEEIREALALLERLGLARKHSQPTSGRSATIWESV